MIDEVVEVLHPILEKFSISDERMKEVFEEDPSLFETIQAPFSNVVSEENLEWILMPLKVYNSRFLEEVNSSREISLNHFVKTLVKMKEKLFYDFDFGSIQDIFAYDYFERISLMMGDSSHIERFASQYCDYYARCKNTLAYLATDFPCTEFVSSLNARSAPWQFLSAHYDLLLSLDATLLRSFVGKNINHNLSGHPTFHCGDIEKIVPETTDGTNIDCGDFSDLLEFVLDNGNTKDAKIKLFPLLTSFYVDKKYDRKDIYSFLWRLNSAPDSFFSFLGENIDTLDYYIDRLLENEFRNSTDLFHYLIDLSSEERRTVFYPLLISAQYDQLSPTKKPCLLESVRDYNVESIQSLATELDSNSILFDDVGDLPQFQHLLHYLSSDNAREFESKAEAIRVVSSQLDAKHLGQYLWYLENSNLHKKREYKAHSAYFKNHSIDEFFDSVDLNSWKKKVLLMKSDDKKKKKQQLKLVKNCSNFQELDICLEVLEIIQYSDDIEKVKNVVNLLINPLFDDLSLEKQRSLIHSFSLHSKAFKFAYGNDELKLFIPDIDTSLEQLPEEGFVKCKGRGKNGSAIEVFIGKRK